MRNSKGQALIEFILILPVFLLVLISIIDFGNILFKKYELENDLDIISNLYMDNKKSETNSYVSNKNIKVNYNENNGLIIIKLQKEVNITSPMLTLIMGKTYSIDVSRSIYKNE